MGLSVLIGLGRRRDSWRETLAANLIRKLMRLNVNSEIHWNFRFGVKFRLSEAPSLSIIFDSLSLSLSLSLRSRKTAWLGFNLARQAKVFPP